MRLWTVHPRYLDTKGLLALWREGLLAQAVLRGATRGYRHHPQLRRFRSTPDPPAAVAAYLRAVLDEADARGYSFDAGKIGASGFEGRIRCTRGQLLYEWEHLKRKLRARDAGLYEEIERLERPEAHPVFEIVEGGVEGWEIAATG
jgi:Pyrimidine dimer DNA glycosylase